MGTYTYIRSHKITFSIIWGLFLLIGLTGEILLFVVPTRMEEIVFFSILYTTIVISCSYAINILHSSITVDSEGIRLKSLLDKRAMLWKDVSEVKFTVDGISIHSTAAMFGLNVSA